jgi:hypothetical protein
MAGERDSNRIQTPSRISKLRIRKTIRSPAIPRKPHSCHRSCHWKSLSRTGSGPKTVSDDMWVFGRYGTLLSITAMALVSFRAPMPSLMPL